MIYVFVAILLFAAVATLVAAMAQRRKEHSDQALRERVGTTEGVAADHVAGHVHDIAPDEGSGRDDEEADDR